MKPPAPTPSHPDTLAPVVVPMTPVEVRPEDVDVDGYGRIVLAVRRRGRVVGTYAAPAGASVVAARMLMDRRSSAVVAETGRVAQLPPAREHGVGSVAVVNRPLSAIAVGLLLVSLCSAGCGYLAAEIAAQRAPSERR